MRGETPRACMYNRPMENNEQLPAFFEPLLAEQYCAEDVERILEGCRAKRATTLRANALRADRGEIAAALDEAGLPWQPVPWYDDAFVLPHGSERALGELPVYQDGRIYLQSLSSMIPALALDAQPREDICDMCAAPGGKTTQIAALTGNAAYLTACEMHAPRAEKLEHNLAKLGAKNVNVMRVDARRMDDFFSFDRVLLDAPCSGSGTLTVGDPRVAKRFTPALVAKSQKAQAALFDKALTLVKPGGTLVYSTCSVLAGENEDIVMQGLKRARKRGSYEVQPVSFRHDDADAADDLSPAEVIARQAPDLPLLPTALEGALCLAPTDRYEGFFVAKIKRLA
ncbi:MAG: RsmB/NOP family class I SAM-dependent RNA methyltransferase [Coriobacteriaceae bacterium]|nr:RsmB/NOP family class I SAM-dependent RNA methyltransferase [Coriobacteriaceae bacterium]